MLLNFDHTVFGFSYSFPFDNLLKHITLVFVGCDIYTSDYHREQAWDRFVYTSGTGLNPTINGTHANYHRVVGILRECARAESERAYFESLVKLHECRAWTIHKMLRDWFTTAWEKNPKVRSLVSGFGPRGRRFISSSHSRSDIGLSLQQ